jgi:hypothetical protein
MKNPCCGRLSVHPLVLGTILLAGAAACSSSGPVQHSRATTTTECASHKVGEVRGAYRSEISSIQRRMGGDYVITRAETPGGASQGGQPATYTVEVFRYNDSRCAGRRR